MSKFKVPPAFEANPSLEPLKHISVVVTWATPQPSGLEVLSEALSPALAWISNNCNPSLEKLEIYKVTS